MKIVFVIGLVCLTVAFAIHFAVSLEPQELPPGYKLLCSITGDKYTLVFPDGHRSVSVFDSKAEAISFACYWEEIKDKPVKDDTAKYEWDTCPDVVDR
jgi:hypothetical protein